VAVSVLLHEEGISAPVAKRDDAEVNAMDTLEAILARRSVRKYSPEPIPATDLARILEAGRQAPSAANRQPWHFVVVTDAGQRQRVAEACNGQTWMAGAGAILCGCGLPAVSEKWCPVDVAIALENMVLAATTLGYGTCWIGAFDAEAVKAALGIPEEVSVIALTPVGVPAESPDARPRKPTSEVFSRERYGQTGD
jgi:nitroreductase